MNILVYRQRVYQYTYNNNNVLRETGAFIINYEFGAFIINYEFGGFIQYTFIHYTLTGAATMLKIAAEAGRYCRGGGQAEAEPPLQEPAAGHGRAEPLRPHPRRRQPLRQRYVSPQVLRTFILCGSGSS